VSIPCPQFVRRAAVPLLILGLVATALAAPAEAQTKVPDSGGTPPSVNVIPIGGGSSNPQVTPDGASVTAAVGANSYAFTVRNSGTGTGTMSTYVSCTGAALACTATPSGFNLVAGGSRVVTVSYTGSSAGGTGTVTLEVDDINTGAADNGYINVTVPPPAPPPPTYTVSVTPDGGTYAMAAGGSSYNFTVTNSGTADATYSLAASCAGGVTACSAPATVFVAAQTSALVNVSISATTPGTTGSVSLTASYGGYTDGGSLNVSVNQSYAVAVTPDNQNQTVSPSGSVTFYVQNLGSIQNTFYLSSNCGCTLSASAVTVNPGYASGVQVTAALNGYTGTVVLTARDDAHGISDQGSIIVSAPSYTVGVGPDGYPDQWYESGQPGTANFSVSNSGNSTGTYNLAVSCDPVAIGCSVPPATVTVGSQSTQTVPITFTAGTPGSSGYVRLNASGPSSDGGSVHVLVYSHTVSVATPASQSVDPGSYTVSFNVTNTGNTTTTYNLASTCGGQITGCTASLGQITIGSGVTSAVSVPYTAVNRGDAGSVTLTASYAGNASVSGSAAATINVKHSYAVAVTPDNQNQTVSPSGAVTFYVQNLGSVTNSFNLSVNCSCTISPAATISVTPGVTSGTQVTVSLNGTTGTVILTASDPAHGISDAGSIIVTAPTYTVSVSPDTNPQTVATAIDANKPGSQTFTVYNAGNSTANYNIAVNCPSTYIANCVWPTTLQVASQTQGSVTVTFSSTGTGGVATIALTASTLNTSDVGTARWQVRTHYVSVAKGLTATQYAGSGLTQLIGVTNTGNVTNSYNLTVSCTGTVSGCSGPPTVSNLAAGAAQQVAVTYTGAGAGGGGTVQLVARNTVDTGVADSGTVAITVKPTYTVAVTPKGGTAQADPWTTASIPFTITNNGSKAGAYSLTTSCTGRTCTLDSAIVSIVNGQSSQVKVSFPAGAATDTGTIKVVAISGNDAFFKDSGTVKVTATTYAVSVTPDGQAVAPAAYATETRPFTVTNTGTTQRTFALQAACGPPAASGCSASSALQTLAAGASAQVNVTYTAGDPGATGTVRLVATDTARRSADGGTLNVTVGTAIARNVVQVAEVNPGTTIERSSCLVFAIVRDVADECGALRITHALPSVRTFGVARTPTLIYSSDQLQGPTLNVNVTLADTTTIPQSVQLVVYRIYPDGHRDSLSRTYPGGDWQTNRRRRVGMYNVTLGDTRILRYSVEARLVYGAAFVLAAPAVSGELAVVDRTQSKFGGGWWLAGLEQLFPGQYDGSVLWVAGDGSTRKYVRQATLLPGDTVYLAAAYGAPDTLLHRTDGKYQRQAGNGLFVEFDGMGLHRRTVNRQGYATVFNFDGSSRLSSIQLPPWRGGSVPSHTYSFFYGATTGLLDSVVAPTNGTQKRSVIIEHNGGGGIRTITGNPGGSTDQVSFETPWSSNTMYSARIDRRRVRTSFTYEDLSPTVATFKTPTGVGTDSVRHTFRTADGVAAGSSSQPVDSAYVRYDGPRLDVNDTTRFWLDRFGAPRRIVNALKQETRIDRGDPRFPALATEIRTANSFTTWAAYDERGNILASTQVNPHGDGKDATTTYGWDKKWNMMTQVIQPEGEVTNVGIDSITGDRAWQEDGRGSMSHVTFQYYTTTDAPTGAMAGLLKAVVSPATATLAAGTSRIRYDTLGNVDTTFSARGAWTASTNDAIGRTTKSSTQIYADSTHVATTSMGYDLKDRVTTTVMTGPATNGVPQQQVTVQNFYNYEGLLDSTYRTQGPDDPITILGTTYRGLWRLVSAWRYDSLGRKIAEIAPDSTPLDTLDNPRSFLFYDLAGNVVKVQSRRKDPITNAYYTTTMTYDELNRLKTRTVPAANYCARWEGIPKDESRPGTQPPYPQYPNNSCVVADQTGMTHFQTSGGYTVAGDVATFDYDNAGNMTVADNADARVRRAYYANGQLQYDSLYTKTILRDTVHKYGLEYLYDRNGRLLTLKHPTELSGTGARYETGTRYDPVTGALSTVINPLSSKYTYTYDARGQVASLIRPAFVRETYDYDQDGNTTQQFTSVPEAPAVFHDVKMTYDLRGKMLTLINHAGSKDSTLTYYSGLGQLHYQEQFTHLKGDTLANNYVSEERFDNDPMGNRRGFINQTTTNYISGAFPGYSFGQKYAAYEYGTGRRLVGMNPGASGNYYRDTTEYDAGGNIVFTTQLRGDVPDNQKADRASFYGADDQLRAVDYRTFNDTQNDFEEYRYDALGRRVVVRARRTCDFDVQCNWSYVRRTVWAGSQELYEIQMPDDSVTVVAGNVLRENDTAVVPTLPHGYFTDHNMYFGRVAYTYGLTTDQPLGITRMAYRDTLHIWNNQFTVMPLWTMRGYADTSVFAETGPSECESGRCVQVSYPGAYWMPAFRFGSIPSAFHGTLMTDKTDASGQLFRRNRYYDPLTGRFTQEDPIGLAGGLNLYGFAEGDPVNFSDPFGLCPTCGDEAVDYYASVATDPSRSGVARGAANVGLAFASLWTSDTWKKTALTLAGGGAASIGVRLVGAAASEAAGAEVSSGATQAMERQLATAGRKSVEKTVKTLGRRIAEHEAKIAEATAQGGKTSSMEREIRAWQETLKAAQKILERQ
jgi:RHS repeat-associated core domain